MRLFAGPLFLMAKGCCKGFGRGLESGYKGLALAASGIRHRRLPSFAKAQVRTRIVHVEVLIP